MDKNIIQKHHIYTLVEQDFTPNGVALLQAVFMGKLKHSGLLKIELQDKKILFRHKFNNQITDWLLEKGDQINIANNGWVSFTLVKKFIKLGKMKIRFDTNDTENELQKLIEAKKKWKYF